VSIGGTTMLTTTHAILSSPPSFIYLLPSSAPP
jgi:hypothetical protein